MKFKIIIILIVFALKNSVVNVQAASESLVAPAIDCRSQMALNRSLATAVKNGEVEAARDCLLRGADVNHKYYTEGMIDQTSWTSMLHLATRNKLETREMFDLIIKGIPESSILGIANVDVLSEYQKSPFMDAVKNPFYLKFFLDYVSENPGSIEINRKDVWGNTPLLNAFKNVYVDSIRLFFEFDKVHPGLLDTKAVGQCGETIFDYASFNLRAPSQRAILELLIEWNNTRPDAFDQRPFKELFLESMGKGDTYLPPLFIKYGYILTPEEEGTLPPWGARYYNRLLEKLPCLK